MPIKIPVPEGCREEVRERGRIGAMPKKKVAKKSATGPKKRDPRGRPKKDPEQRRTVLLRITATEDQAALLKAAAESAGAPLSTWLLQLGLGAARRTRLRSAAEST
jgi:hypothetical protein